jgi:hypothetical protein
MQLAGDTGVSMPGCVPACAAEGAAGSFDFLN